MIRITTLPPFPPFPKINIIERTLYVCEGVRGREQAKMELFVTLCYVLCLYSDCYGSVGHGCVCQGSQVVVVMMKFITKLGVVPTRWLASWHCFTNLTYLH